MTKTKEKSLQLTLLTVPEAAQELRVSQWFIYKLIQTNQLPTVKIRTRRFVASDDLAHFIDEHKEKEYAT